MTDQLRLKMQHHALMIINTTDPSELEDVLTEIFYNQAVNTIPCERVKDLIAYYNDMLSHGVGDDTSIEDVIDDLERLLK